MMGNPATFLLLSSVVMIVTRIGVDAGIPVPEEFFESQKIDHLGISDNDGLWSQRYYSYGKHFRGPGHPIFLILGGEGGIPPSAGIRYPFVGDHLAKTFGGYVLQPEHRFYGKSQPLSGTTPHSDPSRIHHGGEDPRVKLFTPEQALHDAVALLEHVREDLGCSRSGEDPSSYCPVVTVGGSYPGFLSAFARILFPDVVDMAYAASAPMKFYAQETDVSAYYDHITKVSEDTLPGCAAGVERSLLRVRSAIRHTKSLTELESVAGSVGICEGSIPDYILSESENENGYGDGFRTKMIHELMMVVGYTFANDNMANYPPGQDTRLFKACEIFTSKDLSPTQKVRTFLTERLHLGSRTLRTFYGRDDARSTTSSSPTSPTPRCWNMTRQLPTGPNATISGGDWSGDGTGPDAESWDFQTCTLLVEAIGFSKDSMFPARDWTPEWLEEHCLARFGVRPRPHELVNRFGFDDLVANNVTKILFTNGLKDGWSVSGIQSNLSDSLIALNFENGAHHSDLNAVGPSPRDSDDIREGYGFVTRLLGKWLGEVRNDLEGRDVASSTE
mmetsp:Transcript_9085/g.26969  ORF Transcript_9085/g.26969 Transcript_9085/m.26969 type:complete len:559 (-) Transcript_9085:632-2308(-)